MRRPPTLSPALSLPDSLLHNSTYCHLVLRTRSHLMKIHSPVSEKKHRRVYRIMKKWSRRHKSTGRFLRKCRAVRAKYERDAYRPAPIASPHIESDTCCAIRASFARHFYERGNFSSLLLKLRDPLTRDQTRSNALFIASANHARLNLRNFSRLLKKGSSRRICCAKCVLNEGNLTLSRGRKNGRLGAVLINQQVEKLDVTLFSRTFIYVMERGTSAK